MSDSRPHVAYVSYNGLTEPLGASQELPYVRELSSRYRFTLVSFEKAHGPVARDAADIDAELRRHGNDWIRLRYHRAAGLFSKAWDLAMGGGRAVPYLFDIRGLQAEESVDAGTWRPGGLRFRLTKRSERTLLARASGIVTLTNAVRPHVQAQPGLQGREPPWEVLPCCVDLAHFRFDPAARARVRESLGLSPSDLLLVRRFRSGRSTRVRPQLRAPRPRSPCAASRADPGGCDRRGLP